MSVIFSLKQLPSPYFYKSFLLSEFQDGSIDCKKCTWLTTLSSFCQQSSGLVRSQRPGKQIYSKQYIFFHRKIEIKVKKFNNKNEKGVRLTLPSPEKDKKKDK